MKSHSLLILAMPLVMMMMSSGKRGTTVEATTTTTTTFVGSRATGTRTGTSTWGESITSAFLPTSSLSGPRASRMTTAIEQQRRGGLPLLGRRYGHGNDDSGGPDAAEATTKATELPTRRRKKTTRRERAATVSATSHVESARRKEWVDRSIRYYSTVMREERRKALGQARGHDTEQYQDRFLNMAERHYFALRKIKDGKHRHAEVIYRRTIDELLRDDESHHDGGCDHAKLAITTLLLALHLQRSGDAVQTRSAFMNFFRIVAAAHDGGGDRHGAGPITECACSAKVLQAFALFEMKQGNSFKSFYIIQKAVQLDPSLRPVLNWKQFRDTASRKKELQQRQQRPKSTSTGSMRP